MPTPSPGPSVPNLPLLLSYLYTATDPIGTVLNVSGGSSRRGSARDASSPLSSSPHLFQSESVDEGLILCVDIQPRIVHRPLGGSDPLSYQVAPASSSFSPSLQPPHPHRTYELPPPDGPSLSSSSHENGPDSSPTGVRAAWAHFFDSTTDGRGGRQREGEEGGRSLCVLAAPSLLLVYSPDGQVSFTRLGYFNNKSPLLIFIPPHPLPSFRFTLSPFLSRVSGFLPATVTVSSSSARPRPTIPPSSPAATSSPPPLPSSLLASPLLIRSASPATTV